MARGALCAARHTSPMSGFPDDLARSSIVSDRSRCLSGYLNLGGQGGAIVLRDPARVLDVPFVPSLARPVLVIASVVVQTGGLDEATVVLRIDGVEICSSFTGGGTPNGVSTTLVGLVPPGREAVIATTPVGAPQINLATYSEVVL